MSWTTTLKIHVSADVYFYALEMDVCSNVAFVDVFFYVGRAPISFSVLFVQYVKSNCKSLHLYYDNIVDILEILLSMLLLIDTLDTWIHCIIVNIFSFCFPHKFTHWYCWEPTVLFMLFWMHTSLNLPNKKACCISLMLIFCILL